MGIYSLTETVPFGHNRKTNYLVSMVVFFLFANKMKRQVLAQCC